jgi:hypothetical protein
MNPLFHTAGPVLGQVNDYALPTLSGLRQIRQDTSADIAELPEVFHRLSSASFERPNANRRDRSSGKKIVSKLRNLKDFFGILYTLLIKCPDIINIVQHELTFFPAH